jgi:hypothetical protein
MTKILSNKSNIDLDYPICRPSLDLDFTQEVLDPRITFSRGSIGTRVNRNRLIETVSANLPRFDFDPVTGECKGLLIEESRQNIALQSENINTSPWSTSTLTFATNSIVAPDGNTTADKLIENPSFSSFKTTAQSVGTISGTYTVSGFFKAGERYKGYIQLISSGGNGAAFFNLRTGTITGGAGTNTITPYGNGWYRITSTQTFTNATATVYIVVQNDSGTSGYTGDGTSGLYLWGAQVEAGAFPTSYIPTSASTVTRTADLAQMTGTNFSSWYNSSEGTLYASINNITTRSSATYDAFVSLTGTDVNRNVMRIYTQTGPGGGAQNKFLGAVAYSPDGSYTFNSFDSNVGGPDRIGKAILSYKKDNFAFTVNGLIPTRDVSGDIPTCNQLLIFGASRFQLAPSGYISRLTYYPRALKPNQLQTLTS